MNDCHLNRRETVGFLASGAAAAMLEMTPVIAKERVRIRENIVTFAASPTKVAALRNGVKVMKDR